MAMNMPRAVIVGASSLLGKELADELNSTAGTVWDLTLVDSEETSGKITSAGDEALVIQPLTAESHTGASVVFFAADGDTTLKHWKEAVGAGASVVDLSGALASEKGVLVRAPLLASGGVTEPRLDLFTEAVVAAHPVSLMLGYVVASLRSGLDTPVDLSATVLLPASEYGKEAMDELHAQTVALLSFQTLPREIFGTQTAFNLNAAFGTDARASMEGVSARVGSELKKLFANAGDVSCAFQFVQAPVFHGCAASLFIRSQEPMQLATLSEALERNSLLTFAEAEDVTPGNAVGEEQSLMQGSLRKDDMISGYWLWIVTDNLRLQARNAVYCANELLALRPDGIVQ